MDESVREFLTGYYVWGAVGFLFGSALIVRNLAHDGWSFPGAVFATTVCIYGGLVGSRILFVLQYDPHLFLTNPGLALTFWEGGLAWLGGPIGGLLAFAVFTACARKPYWRGAGAYAPGIALAHAISRIGCLCKGCCYGASTTLPWAIYSAELGAKVHPTPIYDMVAEGLVALLLQWLWARKPAIRARLFPLYGLLLAAHRFCSEAFRGTPPGPALIPGLRFYQSVCVLVFVISAVILLFQARRTAFRWLGALIAFAACLAILFIAWPRHAPAITPPDPCARTIVVVTRSEFVDPMASWIEYRQQQGYVVRLKDWREPPPPELIQAYIREAAPPNATVLVVGDCAPDGEKTAPWHMPTFTRENAGGSDAPFGDLDGDGTPDLAVGRWPVRDTAQIDAQLRRIKAYEASALDPQASRFIAWIGGESGQDGEGESVLDEALRSAFGHMDSLLPAWADSFVIGGPKRSAFTGYPADQLSLFLNAIQRPFAMAVLFSHGSTRSVTLHEEGGEAVSLCIEDLAKMEAHEPGGPLWLLGCDSGNFASPQLSLAEAFIAPPGGPIGVVASSGTTFPSVNYEALRILARATEQPPESLGALWLAFQRALAQPGGETPAPDVDEALRLILTFEEGQPGAPKTPEARARQALCYNLLGDPATPLHLASPMQIDCAVDNASGTIRAHGTTPPGAQRLIADLVYRRAETETWPEQALTPAEQRQRFAEANRPAKRLAETPLAEPEWEIAIPIPPEFESGQARLRFLALGTHQACFATFPPP